MTAGLSARGVTKRFAGIAALSDVDLDVADGEFVGLIGPNGAGKTTLFNCLLGLTKADAGTVTFDGVNLASVPTHRRARLGIARTFQRMELFAGMTVREHLIVTERARLGPPRMWRDLAFGGRVTRSELDRADELLEMLDLHDDADRPVEALSLGRGRLVELARAVMTQPKLLLLDEPSSGLDANETEVVIERLRELNERGIAVLLVEHDVAMVQALAKTVFVLDFGTLIASGPTAEVFGTEAVQRAYLGGVP